MRNRHMQRLVRILLTASFACTAFVASAQDAKPASLDIGDRAPLLKPSRWLKGSPVTRFEKGKVYVVEFWATWCGPCKAAMPHLSQLARKYNGQVDLIGVDAFEPKELPKVAAFVKAQGKRMDYRVAADAPGDRTWGDWLTAAGESGIPTAFVVGKDGRVAWIGGPSGLDEILPKAIAGTLDLDAEKSRRAAARDPRSAILIALGASDYTKAIALIDKENAKQPGKPTRYPIEHYRALAFTNIPELRRRVRSDVEKSPNGFETFNWTTLALLTPGLSPEAYRFGVEVAEEARKKCDQPLLFLVRGSELAMNAGDRAKAVDLLTEAVKVGEKTPSCTPERLAELRRDLEKYKASGH